MLQTATTRALLLAVIVMGGCAAFCGCTTERIISTETIVVGMTQVDSSPEGDVYLDGRPIGRSPLAVAIEGKRQKVERVTRKAGRNIDDALIVGIPVTCIFPPAGVIVLLCYGGGDGFVATKREMLQRDETVTHAIEVRRDDYVAARLAVSSTQAPRAWRPTLELTAAAKAERERERQVAEAARRKAQEEQSAREQAARLTQAAVSASHRAGEALEGLDEIVNEAVKTKRNLLSKEW